MTDGDEPASDATGTAEERTRATGTAMAYGRQAAGSGALAGVGGTASLLWGVRALRRDDGGRALRRFLLGGLLLGVAALQRRRAHPSAAEPRVEESDVVGTTPDIEGVSRGEATSEPDATGEEASDVVRSIDVGDAAEGDATDAEPGRTEEGERAPGDEGASVEGLASGARDAETSAAPGDAATAEETDAEAYDRLGEAAFDEQSSRVPAPQPAFNEGLLSEGAEAFWGVREADDLVVVSGVYDPLDELAGVEYVASSEVADEGRGVRVPSTVLTHWDEVAGGGTAVTSGTGLVFATTADLRADDLLAVVPEQWEDEVLEQPTE